MGCSALDLLAWFPGTLLREQQKREPQRAQRCTEDPRSARYCSMRRARMPAGQPRDAGATVLGFKWFLRIGVHNAQGSRQGVTSSGDTNHGRASPAGIQ